MTKFLGDSQKATRLAYSHAPRARPIDFSDDESEQDL